MRKAFFLPIALFCAGVVSAQDAVKTYPWKRKPV